MANAARSTGTAPLESNPWFAYMLMRKKVKTERAMIAIALKFTREIWTTPVGKCGKGHPLYAHPFASDPKEGRIIHMCPTCATAAVIASKNKPNVASQTPRSQQLTLPVTVTTVDNFDQRSHLSDEDVSYLLNH